jgi:BirA family biotin operon repressor/biotin-[acetyl-CoA-carboxylase] ligase
VSGRVAEPAPAVLRLGSVTSTQDVALDLAARGAPDRSVVVADHQTAGRGRRGRTWEAEPGASLLVSIVVRTPLPLAARPRLSFAAALAVADALRDAAGLAPRLRWPNDVLVGGQKIAGILLEAREGGVVVVGIGVNVRQRAFPPGLRERATSVALAGGRDAPADLLLAALLAAFDRWRDRLEGGDFAGLRAAWLARADTIGREVRVEGRAGVAVGLDEDGALLVREGGAVHRVTAGALEA